MTAFSDIPNDTQVWFNGKFVDWKDANIHVMSHGLHYGSSVFEGIRCYETKKGKDYAGDHPSAKCCWPAFDGVSNCASATTLSRTCAASSSLDGRPACRHCGRSSPARVYIRVVFPIPLAPHRKTRSPAGIARSIPR